MALGLKARRLGFCCAFLLIVAVPSSGQWARVATGGIDDGMQREVSGLAIFGSEVYLATHRLTGAPRVFRATIRDDDVWEDVTPPGMTGEIHSINVAIDELLVTTLGGQLWRRDLAGTWSDITPSPPGWEPVRPLTFAIGWTPRHGGRMLCVARQGLQVWCRENLAPWTMLSLPGGLGSDPTIGHATPLEVYEDRLYLGISGEHDGDRTCEAWQYDFGPRRWEPVTTDCFGRPGLNWLLSMAVFNGRLYFGTGGARGTRRAGIIRTDGHVIEDVTPCDLWGGCADFSPDPSPVRFQAMALAASQLFMGIRGGSAPGSSGSGYVLSTRNGTAWIFASERGFGVLTNDSVTALGSRRAYLYAGTFNGDTGFEVWRRTPTLSELYPHLLDDTFRFLRESLTIRACLLSKRACDFSLGLGLIEAMSLAFDAAQHPKDDPAIVKIGRAGMSDAQRLMAEAQELLAAAEQATDPKGARELRREAVSRVSDAMQVVFTTLMTVGDYLQPDQNPR